MSGGGGTSGTSQTNSSSVTQLPPWINQAAQQNYAYAQNVANRPLQQYQGQQVADVGPQTQQAWNMAAGGGNAGQDQYNASSAGYLGVLGQQPMNVQAGQLSNTDLSPYMNPYTKSVINQTLPLMQQQNALQQNQLQNAASSNNAFGGSRQGVQQGVAQAQGAMNIGQMAAQLNQANFGQAQAAATGDITRNLTAAQGNQQAQQNQAGLNLQAAGGLGTLGQLAQRNQLQQFGELTSAGQQQQAQQQAQIDAQKNQFQQAWQYPTQQLGALQSGLMQTPYGQAQMGQSTTEQQQQQSMSPFSALMSGLQMGGSLFGAGGAFPGVGAAIGKAFGGAARGTSNVRRGVLGPPSGADRIPTLLSPGEAVLNPAAADIAGRDNIERLNRAGMGAAPRIPGPLAAPGAIGQIGPLGSPMTGRPPRKMGKTRYPPVRGALGG